MTGRWLASRPWPEEVAIRRGLSEVLVTAAYLLMIFAADFTAHPWLVWPSLFIVIVIRPQVIGRAGLINPLPPPPAGADTGTGA